MKEFESPLRIAAPPPIDFGVVTQGPELVRLRWEMNRHLFNVCDELPEPLASEARYILSRYSGGDNDFFRLFYVPIWSFLHWLAPEDPQVSDLAIKVHALSLFIHLWDDHLCDRQLEVDLLRLQFRTLCWSRFVTGAEELCLLNGSRAALVAQHVADYLVSLHRPQPVVNVEEYSRRFVSQMAICTLVPRLLGGEPLRRVIEDFGIAWRLLDDLQDVHIDAEAGRENAVSLEDAEQAVEGWSGIPCLCGGKVVDAICRRLRAATTAAADTGCWEMTRELQECEEGLWPNSPRCSVMAAPP